MNRTIVIVYARVIIVFIYNLLLPVNSIKPVLRNSYPDSRNYSLVTLFCYEEGITLARDAVFRWNNVSDVEDVMQESHVSDGEMTIVLTQQKEGTFHCESNGNYSNAMDLAAQPLTVNTTTEIYINPTDHIDIELACGIQPGALIQKYRVSWKKFLINDDTVTILSDSTFNLSINTTGLDSLHYIYECIVTVQHNESIARDYDGGRFMFKEIINADNPEKDSNVISVVVLGVIVPVCIIFLTLIIATIMKIRHKTQSDTIKSTYSKSADVEYKSNALPEENDYTTNEQEIEVTIHIDDDPNSLTVDVIDDDDQDLDLVRAISSTCSIVPDDNSFSPNAYFVDENLLSRDAPHFLYASQEESIHFKAVNHCSSAFSSDDLPISKYLTKEPCKVVEESECINPQCQCQKLRRQKLVQNVSPYDRIYDLSQMETTTSSCIPGLPSIPFTSQDHSGMESYYCTDDDDEASSKYFPAWMQRVHVLKDCTEEGLVHTDENYGFILEIPAGAIPNGLKLIVDVGVCLYGPFQYPECVQRVSPIVWLCVRDIEHFHFLKPVKITLQHCVQVDDAVSHQSLGLKFLKASHATNSEGYHTFETSDGSIICNTDNDYMTLSTDHFCYMCIVSDVQPETLKRIQYCLSPFYPQPIINNQNDELHFYVSFFLKACLTTIGKQCGRKYRHIRPTLFSFKHSNCLKISFTQPQNWVLSLQCNEEIDVHDVDFHHKNHEQLRIEEDQGMYPPKFTIGLLSLHTAESTKVRFKFHGADKTISMDIPLHVERHCLSMSRDQLLTSPLTPASSREPSREASPSTPYKSRIASVPLTSFMEHVASLIRTKWRFFGIMIDIPPDVLDSFPADNALHCFERVFDYWYRRGSPPLTWEAVVNVLESETVDEKKVGADIRNTFLPAVQPLPQKFSHCNSSESQYSQQTKSSSDTGYSSHSSRNTHPTPIVIDDATRLSPRRKSHVPIESITRFLESDKNTHTSPPTDVFMVSDV